mgnify:CR=1 FL=1
MISLFLITVKAITQIITETSEPAASEGVDTAETILFVKIRRIAVSASDTAIKSVTVFPLMGGMSIAFLIFIRINRSAKNLMV